MQLSDNWRPSASLELLQQRAALLRQLREFFWQRQVLEVDTPLLSRYGVTDVHLSNLQTEIAVLPNQPFYLQTSPEYAMKRLLAAYGCSIYQLGKVFRDDEVGPRHNPEFTMLEWYRVGFTMAELIAEVVELLLLVLGERMVVQQTYQELFQRYLAVDPLAASVSQLQRALSDYTEVADLAEREDDRDTLLQLAMACVIEPRLNIDAITIVTHFPSSQAALAEIAADDSRVALRFEVYAGGIELANGYQELTQATEQTQRFAIDNQLRLQLGRPQAAADTRLLQALAAGFPNCAGVALGFDRLLMIQSKKANIQSVLPFDLSCA
ncbi:MULTISPECIES: EF-P lysine aminoacylase EpmA [Idiomarina]|uniref:EF-P lysine aminoacylase EpmA n=1 Tax=Idiomarina TaxID=135575 RepID=UPI001389C906|nr:MULTISPECIES: EF-P lysine aminoacylase EpmA [Idiomarina]MRJ43120.1 EF-P lysine aminoacylase GenX [Idiomarina sp. FeN1]NCU58638.1 EF-P lysine aminoacylase GenX [Idiomarina sp. FenA--70]NCU61335.1 EF-P lysine aminoacylase GenX [Idiomarina sp. FenBw--71]UUN13675.1 EF-P lysine aminoacylase GenX [Idiomarina loihiensis]